MENVEQEIETTQAVETVEEVEVQLPEEVLVRVKELEASKARVESESRKWKEKFQRLSSEREESDKEKAKKEGNYQEVLEQEKSKLMDQMGQIKKSALKKELRAEVSKYARDAYDIDDIVKSLDSSLLEIDEEELSIKGIQEAVSKVREAKQYLFNSKQVPGYVSSKPESKAPPHKTLAEMNSKEKQNILKSLLG